MMIKSAPLFVMSITGLVVGSVEAFVPHRTTATNYVDATTTSTTTTTALHATNSDRRAFLATITAAASGGAAMFGLADTALAEQAPEFRQGIQVNAFNGLIFNYRGGDFGGLDATTLQEPSISYAEFNTRLKAGEVEFVEFLAPDGDVAYVTLKASKDGPSSKPIRIGEGYPIEQHDGYSSPMFCVRAVKNAGVPYKFTVPALAKINN